MAEMKPMHKLPSPCPHEPPPPPVPLPLRGGEGGRRPAHDVDGKFLLATTLIHKRRLVREEQRVRVFLPARERFARSAGGRRPVELLFPFVPLSDFVGHGLER